MARKKNPEDVGITAAFQESEFTILGEDSILWRVHPNK